MMEEDGRVGSIEEGAEALAEESEKSPRGIVIAPFGDFDVRELAARKIRRIMGIA